MSSPIPSIKRHNHRIHPCEHSRKPELLNLLVTNNIGKSILVVTANGPLVLQDFPAYENIVIRSDTELASTPELTCDLLISYDLPKDAADYMARLARTKAHAVILLDRDEQTQLYPIEMLLGRNIMQEIISGFGPEPQTPSRAKSGREERPRRDERPQQDKRARKDDKRPADKRDDNKSSRNDRRPDKRAKRSDDKAKKRPDQWKDKEKKSSRYIGKDENGKPMFSGKSGERNHRYDGTPKDSTDKRAARQEQKKPEDKERQSSERRPNSYDEKKREDSNSKRTYNKPASHPPKSKQNAYDKTSKPKPKAKRTPRTFRVQADKGTRGGK